MSLDTQTELSQAEVDEFLGRHETGVLSLARGDDPYSIPISYGYDATDRTFYLRLVSTPESEKREFLSSSPRARLVVYEEDEPTYLSVVSIGRLEPIEPEDLTASQIEQYGEAKRPLFEVWADDKPDLDIELYQFHPGELTGRRIQVER